MSEDLWRVLTAAEEVHRASGGAFNIALGPAVALWRTARDQGTLPDAPTLEDALRRSDPTAIVLGPTPGSVTLTRPGVRLDLGGIGKGYAAMEAVRTLRARGAPRALVALAGDIAVGDPPPASPGARAAPPGWTIELDGAASPTGPTGARSERTTVVVRNQSVSTSGNTAQWVEIDGRRFGHLIDPRTGLGTEHAGVVTVIGPEGARVDALATALAILPMGDHARVARAFPGYRILVHEPAPPPASSPDGAPMAKPPLTTGPSDRDTPTEVGLGCAEVS